MTPTAKQVDNLLRKIHETKKTICTGKTCKQKLDTIDKKKRKQSACCKS